MKKLFEKKINIVLMVVLAILIVVTIVAMIIWIKTSASANQEVSLEDKLNSRKYFESLAVNLDVKRVKRDGIDISLIEMFGISKEDEENILSSRENLIDFFSGSTYEIYRQENNIIYIKNDYQTKKIIVYSPNTKIENKNSFSAKSIIQMPSGLYILEYETKKKTRAAEDYFTSQDGVKVMKDEVAYVTEISDESQTMYGENGEELAEGTNSRGVTDLGLNNFKKIVEENGNPNEIIVSTVGYGMQIQNSFFNGRISNKYYNFIDNKKDASETISQGSRIAEVIIDATSSNVKLLPVKVVNEEGYTTTATLINGIEYATKFSDVICYELVGKQSDAIDISLKNAYKEEKPFCAVTTKGKVIYPANHETTIATASLNKNLEIATYSGEGEYIDFAVSSTDIKEIFNDSLTVSRWSGVQYSNAIMAAEVAMLKTYNKDLKIKDLYNELMKYSEDKGASGKDDKYGNGIPKFQNLQISDLDKTAPEMKDIEFNNDNWEKLKKIKISANDNIRIMGWQVTETEETPGEWNNIEGLTPALETETEINHNGKYLIWVRDSANNTSNKQIEINKVDNTAPTIEYTINKDKLLTEGFATINVEAKDEESGLAESPYSWDNTSWGKENNSLKVNENGRYTIYCRDNVGNVSNKEVVIDLFAIKAQAIINEGNVIKSITPSVSWNNNTNLDVQIILKNTVDIVAWQISKESTEPTGYVVLKQNETNGSNNSANSSNQNNTINVVSNSTNSKSTANNNITTNTTTTNTINNTNSIISTIPQSSSSEFNTSNSHVAITANFEAGTTYYIWVIDSNGKKYSQSFRIEKVQY